ncbi:TetR/AcrR family transcriptional regulator [Arcanobacterium haemolyticum]|nr:TetR/AcrR family transcriptional regulator [Arcanobacterium haemolyticum]
MCKSTRLLRSRDKLRSATQNLLDERDSTAITVTDIVKAAGVTRPTFYAAYNDLPTAFADAALHRISAAIEPFTLDSARSNSAIDDGKVVEDMHDAYERILSQIEHHSTFYLRAAHAPGGLRILASVNAFIAERLESHSPISSALRNSTIPVPSACSALAAGVTWLTLEWLDSPSRQSPREFAHILRTFVYTTVNGGITTSSPSMSKDNA